MAKKCKSRVAQIILRPINEDARRVCGHTPAKKQAVPRGTVVCKKCGDEFSNSYLLESHTATQHPSTSPKIRDMFTKGMRCIHCNAIVMNSLENLGGHLARRHPTIGFSEDNPHMEYLPVK